MHRCTERMHGGTAQMHRYAGRMHGCAAWMHRPTGRQVLRIAQSDRSVARTHSFTETNALSPDATHLSVDEMHSAAAHIAGFIDQMSSITDEPLCLTE